MLIWEKTWFINTFICQGAICCVHYFDTNIQVEWYATFPLLTSIVFMYIFLNPSALIMS